MSVLFSLKSFIVVLLLIICNSTYLKKTFPSYIDHRQEGFKGLLGRFARIGERLSIYISLFCIMTAIGILVY